VGVCLQVISREFRGGPLPSLSDYAKSQGVSRDTIRRASDALIPQLEELVAARRPGPKADDPREDAGPCQKCMALEAVNGILQSLLPDRVVRLLDTPQKRGLVVQAARSLKSAGLTLEAFGKLLGLATKTLYRWIQRSEEPGTNGEVPFKSRRPNRSPNQIPSEIQEAIFKLGCTMKDLPAAEVAKVLRQRFGPLLKKHGLDRISDHTVRRYVPDRSTPSSTKKPGGKSPRGAFEYPSPLAMAWIDTTHFTVVGVRVHIVAAMEAFSRMTLAAEVFVQENAQAAVEVMSQALERVPELEAILRDRGTPFLNKKVNEFLAERGCLPINAHPYFPLDKAALERWWSTLKDWLGLALKPFEEECRQQGRTPTKDEIVKIVAPALRVYLRAYNLLPQTSFEGSCPLERLKDALAELREREDETGLLHRIASERRDREELLVQIREGLQLGEDLSEVRRIFGRFSTQALRAAIDVCSKRLVEGADPTISRPLGYLWAVAQSKDDALQRQKRIESKQRIEYENNQQARIQDEKRRLDLNANPENYLFDHLEIWSRFQAAGFVGIFDQTLSQTLGLLRGKLGDAYLATVTGALPIVRKHLDGHVNARFDEDKIEARFLQLVHECADEKTTNSLASLTTNMSSSTKSTQPVRQAQRPPPVPHDCRTYVPSQHS